MSTSPLQRYRPPSFIDMFRKLGQERDISPETRKSLDTTANDIHLAMRVAYDQLYALDDDRPIEAGGRVRWGKAKVTGSELAIDTGLTTIESAQANIQSSAALNEWVTLTFTKGLLSIYIWKPTAAGDTTPIAGTVERVILWSVQGS